MSSPLGEMLDRSLLWTLAGARSYERGEDYFEGGCVERLAIEGDALLAIVQGSHRYRVELRPAHGTLEHSCTCPYAQEGAFCKHCVAAGLAFLETGTDAVEIRPEAPPLDDIRARLEDLDRDALVSLLLSEAKADERVLERLRLRFAADPDRVAREEVDDWIAPVHEESEREEAMWRAAQEDG